jgi:apolipoprotein N-acyltransferase
VIWPEGAIPVINFFMLENPDFMSALGRGLGDRVLITGLTRREARAGGVAYFNSAAVIDGVNGEARLSQTYDKHHLVPFGEYIPLWSLISSFNIAPLRRIGAGFEAGAAPTRLIVPGAPTAVVLICYEAIFPGMIPHGDARPGWIVMVTNDAWFGGGSGPYQHYAMARYRAIEEGLPVARAASGGTSAIVDAYGREVAATTLRTEYAEAQLPPALQRPSRSRAVYCWPIICIIGAPVHSIRKKRAGRAWMNDERRQRDRQEGRSAGAHQTLGDRYEPRTAR